MRTVDTEPARAAWFPFHPEVAQKEPFSVLQFFPPIIFLVQLIKAQSQVVYGEPSHSVTNLPTEYFASWDGTTLVVAWRHAEVDGPVPGGLVAAGVLCEAIKRAEQHVYLQSPALDGKFEFVQKVLNTIYDPTVPALHLEEGAHSQVMTARIPSPSPLGAMRCLARDVCLPAAEFAALRNITRRLVELEADAQSDAILVLEYDHWRAVTSTLPWLERIRQRWVNRGWQKRMRVAIGRSAITISRVHHLSRDHEVRSNIISTRLTNVMPLFRTDYRNDLDAINRIGTRSVETIIGRFTQSLDTRLIVVATAVGALGGAIAGAVAGLIR